MTYSDFRGSELTSPLQAPVSVSWQSPSNIALVKYWGKTGQQLPVNPSLSMTLSKAFTETKLTALQRKIKGDVELDLWFEGKPNADFSKRISGFLQSITEIFPWLIQVSLKLETHNTFPHSTGIASSASAFSALALCLCSLDTELNGIMLDENEFRLKALVWQEFATTSPYLPEFSSFAIQYYRLLYQRLIFLFRFQKVVFLFLLPIFA